MKTEKAKSSHFDRTRGDKNQIFRTLLGYTRDTKRHMYSVFHKTGLNFWAGQKFLAENVLLPTGQHFLS